MRSARLLVVLLNLGLLAILAYAGVQLYFSDYFKGHDLPTIPDKDKLKATDIGPRIGSYELYRPLEELARKPDAPKPVEPAPVVETGPPPLQVEIRSIVYRKNNPDVSGAHIVVKGVPRFIGIDDTLPISKDMPYRLKEIQESKPGKEYNLIFEDEKGTRKQATYKQK